MVAVSGRPDRLRAARGNTTIPQWFGREVMAEEWADHASCRGLSVDLFFPDDERAAVRVAQRVCRGCPVRQECLEYALRKQIDHGVWGGVTERGRQRMGWRWRHGQVS